MRNTALLLCCLIPSALVQTNDVVQQLTTESNTHEQETSDSGRMAQLRMISRQIGVDEDALKKALQTELDGIIDTAFVDDKAYLTDIQTTEQVYQVLEQKLYEIFSQKQAYENFVNHVSRRSCVWSAPFVCAGAWLAASCDAHTIATLGKWGVPITAVIAAMVTAADYMAADSFDKREETVAQGYQQLMKVMSFYQQMSAQQASHQSQDGAQADEQG